MSNIFKVLEDCTISWRGDDNRETEFVLYTDSIFYIKQDVFWERYKKWSNGRVYDKYEAVNILDKIYYNKMIGVNSSEKEWTWINDINIINPFINKNIHIEDCTIIEDITDYQNRESFLEKLI